MAGNSSLCSFLHHWWLRAKLEARFVWTAVLLLDFDDPRVQEIVTAKLRLRGFDV